MNSSIRSRVIGPSSTERRRSTNCETATLFPLIQDQCTLGQGRVVRGRQGGLAMGVTGAAALLSLIKQKQDLHGYRERHWTGSLADYMEIVMASPRVARNAYQRLYDMILSHGATDYARHHERHTHYRLFDDPVDNGRDAVFGLDGPLMRLVHNLKSAAYGY